MGCPIETEGKRREIKKSRPQKGREDSRGTTLLALRPLGTVNDVPAGLFFPASSRVIHPYRCRFLSPCRSSLWARSTDRLFLCLYTKVYYLFFFLPSRVLKGNWIQGGSWREVRHGSGVKGLRTKVNIGKTLYMRLQPLLCTLRSVLYAFHRNGSHIDRRYTGFMTCHVIKKNGKELRSIMHLP